MAKGYEVKVEGLANVEKFLKEKNEEVVKQVEQTIGQATAFLAGEIKESIAGNRAEPRSIDTGQFLNSIVFSSNKLLGTVASTVEHSIFLEFGTSRIEERRHFGNSLDRNKDKIVEFIDKGVKEATKN